MNFGIIHERVNNVLEFSFLLQCTESSVILSNKANAAFYSMPLKIPSSFRGNLVFNK